LRRRGFPSLLLSPLLEKEGISFSPPLRERGVTQSVMGWCRAWLRRQRLCRESATSDKKGDR